MPYLVEQLNTDCLCGTLDGPGLAEAFTREIGDRDFAANLQRTHPGLLSRQQLFLSAGHAKRMQEIISAIEAVAGLPGYRDTVLSHAPEIARFDPGPIGVFMGYDFHLGPNGPQLIEINTNAGGALLNAYLAEAQKACCAPAKTALPRPPTLADLCEQFLAAFRAEWRLLGRTETLRSVAIVDDDPAVQFLYPEFQLFQRLLQRQGLIAVIADGASLQCHDGALWHGSQKIDLVYNRLTDFALAELSHQALHDAYLARMVAVTPNPRAHALYADKRNLIALGNAAQLQSWGVAPATIDVLQTGIAACELVTVDRADALWQSRAKLFFKPARGYGSKAAYRGDKITKRVWADILAGEYIAQALVRPSARGVRLDGTTEMMKVDVRNYSYAGKVQLLVARLYQGQTTNMRTPGGGFAPVFTADEGTMAACRCL